MFFLGAAVSGAVVFVSSQSRVTNLREQLRVAEEDLKRAQTRIKQLEAAGGAGSARAQASGPETETAQVLERVSRAIAYVEGKDQAGTPTVGSGVVIQSDRAEAWVLTNYALVAGAVGGEEAVTVRVGRTERRSTVYVADEVRDLAVIVVRAAGLPYLERAPSEPAPGTQVWAAGTSPGASGAAAVPGRLIDVAPDGFLTDIDLPAHLAGGPLVNREGRVLGITSLRYVPQGFGFAKGWVIPFRMACARVLRCPQSAAG
jgi:S1-C subfamily serine protease